LEKANVRSPAARGLVLSQRDNTHLCPALSIAPPRGGRLGSVRSGWINARQKRFLNGYVSVLITEDDAKTAQAVRQGLRGEGYDVAVARTGDEGLALLQTEAFDFGGLIRAAKRISSQALGSSLCRKFDGEWW